MNGRLAVIVIKTDATAAEQECEFDILNKRGLRKLPTTISARNDLSNFLLKDGHFPQNCGYVTRNFFINSKILARMLYLNDSLQVLVKLRLLSLVTFINGNWSSGDGNSGAVFCEVHNSIDAGEGRDLQRTPLRLTAS